jgi:hypothetical protein
MMILSSGYTTSMTVYLSRPEPGSATPQAIDEFANEVMPACVRAVLATGKFDPPWFEPRKTAEIMMSSDGPIALRMRQKVPTAVVGLSSRDNQLTCRIISGDPIDAVPAIKSALIRAFLALPGAVDNAGELSLADAATGRKLLLNIEPFGDRVSATIGLAHAEDQKLN